MTPAPHSRLMVRVLVGAIAFMTLAIVVLLAAIVARFLNPRAEEPTVARSSVAGSTVDFAAAPEVEIGLPPGARVVETHVSAERATFVIETAGGERAVYTAPLTGFDTPTRLVFRTLE